MLKKYESPLWLELKSSENLKYLIMIIRTLALAACLSNALPIAIKSVLFVTVYVYFVEFAKRQKNGQYIIKYSYASGWELSSDASFEAVCILPSTVVTKYAVFLHFVYRQQGSRLNGINKKALLIFTDMLNDDEYRQLSAKLITTAIKQEHVSETVDKIKSIEINNTSV